MNSIEQPFFTVVVPTYERPADLNVCLEALSYHNQAGAPNYEIIVSDDSKTDRSRILIKKGFPHVHWEEGKKIGPAGNRNAGVAKARGQWVVFLDDDCIAQKGYLVAYANAIADNPDFLVFEGRIYADRPRKTWAEGCPENEHGGMLWTSNLCVQRKLYIDLGGLDERFEVAYEDVEFAHRLKQINIASKFVSKAAVCHPWRTLRRKGNNWKPQSYELNSLLLFLDKHPDAQEEHGAYPIYLKNFARMIFKDMPYCLFRLRGRGIDILLSQAIVSFQISLILAFRRIYKKK